MKTIPFLISLVIVPVTMMSQRVGIGTTTPNPSSALEIKANDKGILIPRTSTVSRNSIPNPAKGLLLYDTTTGSFWNYSGSAWINLAAATAGNSWLLSGNAGIVPGTNFLGTLNESPLLFRVKNTWAGIIDSAMNNTSIGFKALKNNSTGFSNSALGSATLGNNTTGVFNTGTGATALHSNTTGSGNTANGNEALYSNTTGSSNVGIGLAALHEILLPATL